MLHRLIATTVVATALAAPAGAGDAAAGKRVAGQCRTCHGIDGIAQIPIAPHLAGESQVYLMNQLKAFRSGKREHEMMSVVAKGMTDEQIADVAAWYASIQITATIPE
ncbi:MAG: cytochrome c [Pseudomonadota bacterium]